MTPERAKAIRDDLPQDVYNIAGPVLGPSFTKETSPLSEISSPGGEGRRLRRWPGEAEVHEGETIQIRAELASTFDDHCQVNRGRHVPSGHSTTAFEVCLVLARCCPSKRDAL